MMAERPVELKLLRPYDKEAPEIDVEQQGKLLERRDFPSDRDWAIYEAKVFYEALGDVSKATEILERQLQKEPEDADVLASLAECYSRTPAQYKKARDHAERALAIDDQSDYAHTILARVHLATDKPIDAYRSAMNALVINSSNYEAGVYLGITGFAIAVAENDLGEMEFSIENLRATQSLNPNSNLLTKIIQENEQVLEAAKSKNS